MNNKILVVIIVLLVVAVGGLLCLLLTNQKGNVPNQNISNNNPSSEGRAAVELAEELSEQPDQVKFDEYFTKAFLGRIPGGEQFNPAKVVKTKVFEQTDQFCTSLDIKKDIPAGALSVATYDTANKEFVRPKSAFPQKLPGGNTMGCEGIMLSAGKYEQKIYVDDILAIVMPFEVK
ncbi:MAG: hypothetical protein PHN39_02555 [Candidatus Pacebacteria bacterium]|nr:hypothetical protein [Candidatus Paceibacterota bacterium]